MCGWFQAEYCYLECYINDISICTCFNTHLAAEIQPVDSVTYLFAPTIEKQTLLSYFNSETLVKMQICVCTVTRDLVIKSLC